MKLKLIFFFILSLTYNYIVAQCCSAGNPLNNNVDYSSLEKNTLKIGLSYNYSESNKYYQENLPIEVGFINKAYFNYSELSMTYGLFNRYNIKTDLGYFYNKTENYNLENISPSKGYGLGDASVQLRYLIYKDFVKKWELSGGIGAKLPVGVFDQEANNIKLPITVQPSSGSYKSFVNLFFVKSLTNEFRFFSYANVEIAKKIDSKNFEYKYGNAYLIALGSNYTFHKNFNANLLFRSEFRAKSQRENKQIVESSGGTIIYLVPGISINLFCKYYLNTSLNLPLYKYLNGIQLSNKFSFHISISRYLDFNKNVDL